MGNDINAILDDVLSLAEAAQISGITAHTLAQQAEKGRLRGRKVGRTWVTTRYWLTEYVSEHARRRRGFLDQASSPRTTGRTAGRCR